MLGSSPLPPKPGEHRILFRGPRPLRRHSILPRTYAECTASVTDGFRCPPQGRCAVSQSSRGCIPT
jgi:hypothetical protein